MPLQPWQWKHTTQPGILRQSMSCFTILTVVTLGKLWGKFANNIRVFNPKGVNTQEILKRPKNTPLVTVSNHLSCIDDPVLWGTLPLRCFLFPSQVRWIPGASDIAFTKMSHVNFFTLGQIVPVVRGDGVYQQGMEFIINKANNGGWIHFFPEVEIISPVRVESSIWQGILSSTFVCSIDRVAGEDTHLEYDEHWKVNMTKDFLRLKWGVGRVIADSNVCPKVIPFWHIGMDEILPNYPPYIPRFGKKVTMLVGEAIDFREMLASMRAEKKTHMQIRKQITDVIQEEMWLLKKRTEEIHFRR